MPAVNVTVYKTEEAVIELFLGVFLAKPTCGVIAQNEHRKIAPRKARASLKGLLIEMVLLECGVLHRFIPFCAALASVKKIKINS